MKNSIGSGGDIFERLPGDILKKNKNKNKKWPRAFTRQQQHQEHQEQNTIIAHMCAYRGHEVNANEGQCNAMRTMVMVVVVVVVVVVFHACGRMWDRHWADNVFFSTLVEQKLKRKKLTDK